MKHRRVENLKTDCFGFRGAEFKEFCSALSGVENCIGCKFYKSRTRMLLEEKRTANRLKAVTGVKQVRKDSRNDIIQ